MFSVTAMRILWYLPFHSLLSTRSKIEKCFIPYKFGTCNADATVAK